MKITLQKGLSLVELMVALALSAAIIAGIIQVFLSNRVAYNLTESSIRVQENGRFAIEFITSALRGAGNYGCLPDYNTSESRIRSFISSNTFTDMKTIQTNADADIGSTSDGAAVAGSFSQPDSLTLLLPTDNTSTVTALTAASPPTFSVSSGSFAQNQYVLVSNCEAGDFIELAAGSNATTVIDATGQLRTDFYQLDYLVTEVTEMNVIRYWVDTNSDTLNTTSYSYTPTGVTAISSVLVNGIENIQFEYGVDADSNGVPEYFDSITDVIAEGDEDNIIAVKAYVLAVSGTEGEAQNVVTDNQILTLAQETATSSDLRFRKVFNTTVVLRNRMN